MRVDVVSIFPDYFAPLDLSLIGKARAAGLLDLAVHDLRTWTHDVHRTVDDTPVRRRPRHGDAPRAVGRRRWTRSPAPAPAGRAVAGRASRSPRPTPHELAALDHLIFACGRYEGIDQRVLDDAADPDAGHARSRSATTCSSAARWRSS